MKVTHKVLFGFALIAGTLAAQSPVVTGVSSSASFIPAGFPNAGIAQGSIFSIYGTNLSGVAAGSIVNGTLPLPNTLAGVSISVTVSGTTLPVPLFYVAQATTGLIAAVMPSTTPVGTGTLKLTFNGNSGSIPITVVASNFGILTQNASGSGPALVTFASYAPVTTSNSAKPGDTLILWGTGLGPLPAGQSDSAGATGGNLPAAITIYVGGVQVPATSILYQGRTPTLAGLDQINFVVPSNAPLGCNVSIIAQTTTPTATVTNGPTISLASTDGAQCSDPTQFLSTSVLSKSSVKAAFVQLKQTSNLNVQQSGTSTTTSQKATAAFFQFSQSQYAAFVPQANTEPALGTCLTSIVAGSSGSGGSGAPTATYLNGGASVTLTPPSSPAIVLAEATSGSELLYQNSSFTTPMPSGTWGYSNAGGPDVGALNFTFPVAAQVTWTNELQLSTGAAIDHTQPLTITWTGGDSNGYVDIQGSGQVGSGSATYTFGFDCSSPTSATKFSIPPAVLAAMPLGANAFSNIQVSTYQFPLSSVSVTGFDAFIVNAEYQVNAPVIFK